MSSSRICHNKDITGVLPGLSSGSDGGAGRLMSVYSQSGLFIPANHCTLTDSFIQEQPHRRVVNTSTAGSLQDGHPCHTWIILTGTGGFEKKAEMPEGDDFQLNERWEVISANSECKPRLSQCIAESWSSYTIFLHELSHYKQQNPGKFCLLVCSVCTFFILLGSYIPGVVLSYFILLCAFLCPLLKCNEIGQKACSKLKPVLQKLDFGLQSFLSLWMKAKSKKETKTTTAEEDSELELSALCPQISPEIAKELSVSGTEPSDLSWTDNGTFNLSEGYTPQTDTSDDLDRPSEEEAFSRGLTEFPSPENGSGSNDEDSSIGIPSTLKRKHEKSHKSSGEKCSAAALSSFLGNEQPYNLVTGVAGEAITAAVTAAITDQLQAALLCSQPPAANFTEDTDIEEADDFELLDQSELEDIDDEGGHSSNQESEGKKPSSGFLSSLLGGH